MISQTAEYALRTVVYLATSPDEPKTAQEIAEVTHIPLAYLSKIIQQLARAGLVRSQRGPHGGVTLRKSPEELAVYEIVQTVDPIRRITTCPLGLVAHGVNLCPLHRRLDDAFSLIEKSFRETTLSDILNEPTSSKPLCAILMEPAVR
jgi:Rrf2 family protein